MGNPRQVVVVEDVFVRSFLRAALERVGYVAHCVSAQEAMRLLRSGEIDLLVTNTPDTFSEFGATIPLLYIAAFPNPANAVAFRRWLPLHKPFQAYELNAVIQRLLR